MIRINESNKDNDPDHLIYIYFYVFFLQNTDNHKQVGVDERNEKLELIIFSSICYSIKEPTFILRF